MTSSLKGFNDNEDSPKNSLLFFCVINGLNSRTLSSTNLKYPNRPTGISPSCTNCLRIQQTKSFTIVQKLVA